MIGCGYSVIIDPWGEAIASCGEEESAAVIAEVDLDYVRDVRSRIGVFADRKPDAYKL